MEESIRSQILVALLRPAVRYALGGTEKLQDIVDLLKRILVEEASKRLAKERKKAKVSISQISLMTGVHRIDASRFTKEEKPPVRRAPTLVARVLGLWESSPDYTTRNGKPRVIPLEGPAPSLEALIAEVSPQLALSGTLYELKRSGVVEETSRGVKLSRAIHFAVEDSEIALRMMRLNIEAASSTAIENMQGDIDPLHVNMRTEYDRIVAAKLPEIRAWMREQSKQFHAKIRNQLAAHDLDFHPELADEHGEATGRVSYTTISYDEALEDEKEQGKRSVA